MPRSARLDVSNVLQHVIRTRDNLKGFWVKCVKEWGVREQILSISRARKVSRTRRVFFLHAHEEAGETMSVLDPLCSLPTPLEGR